MKEITVKMVVRVLRDIIYIYIYFEDCNSICENNELIFNNI